MKTKICLMFVLLLGYAWVVAEPITVPNYSFELPGDGKHNMWNAGTNAKGTFTDVPNWTSDTAAADSGVETATTTDGSYRGFLMVGDPSVWQVLDHTLASGEVYTLSVDALNAWECTSFMLSLFYDNSGTRVTLATSTVTITASMATYTLTAKSNDLPASIGKKLGIELKAIDPDNYGWAGMDNIRLSTAFVDVIIPANGVQNVAIDTNLQWTVANSWKVDVYLSGPYAEPNSTPALTKVVNNQAATSYDPTLVNDRWYYWHVDAHEPNIPNDIVHVGPNWSFKTVPATASISAVTPAFTAVNAGTVATLSVTGVSVTSYQWFKIGSPDVQLTEGVKYSNVTTNTLTVNNVQQADEGYYYCIGFNTIPTSASNRDTGPGRVMIKRLTSYYPMEVINVVDGNDVTPDTVGGLTMTLKQEGTAGLAILAAGVTELGGNGLQFTNSDTDPNGQYAQIVTGVVNYDDITIELWTKWNGGANWQRILDFGNDITHYMFLTPSNGTEARFVLKNGTGAEQIVSTSPLSTGQWIHVAATLSGNTGRLYINGELKATNTSASINPIDFKPTLNYIGKSQYTVDPEFDGTLDDMKIYNYARTSMEIAQDYTAVKGGWVCNVEGTASMKYDLDKNCRVDLADFALIAADWLESNRIYPIQ